MFHCLIAFVSNPTKYHFTRRLIEISIKMGEIDSSDITNLT